MHLYFSNLISKKKNSFAGNIKETTEKFDLIQGGNKSGGTLQFSNQHDPSDLPIFEFGSILVATDNFNMKNKLGQGGFGSVYKVVKYFSWNKLMHNYNYVELVSVSKSFVLKSL